MLSIAILSNLKAIISEWFLFPRRFMMTLHPIEIVSSITLTNLETAARRLDGIRSFPRGLQPSTYA